MMKSQNGCRYPSLIVGIMILVGIAALPGAALNAQTDTPQNLPNTMPPRLMVYIAIDDTELAMAVDPNGRRFDTAEMIVNQLRLDQAGNHLVGVVAFHVSGAGFTNGLQPTAEWITPPSDTGHLLSLSGMSDAAALFDSYRRKTPLGRGFTSIGSAIDAIRQDLLALDPTITAQYKPALILLTASPLAYSGLNPTAYVQDRATANSQIERLLNSTDGLGAAQNRLQPYTAAPHCLHSQDSNGVVRAAFTFGDASLYNDPAAPTAFTLPSGQIMGSLYANRWSTRTLSGSQPLIYPVDFSATSQATEAVINFLREIRCTVGGELEEPTSTVQTDGTGGQNVTYEVPISNLVQQVTLTIQGSTSINLPASNVAANVTNPDAYIRRTPTNGGEIIVLIRPPNGWEGTVIQFTVTTTGGAQVWYDYTVNLSEAMWQFAPNFVTVDIPPNVDQTLRVQLVVMPQFADEPIPVREALIVTGLQANLGTTSQFYGLTVSSVENTEWTGVFQGPDSNQYPLTFAAALNHSLGTIAPNSRYTIPPFDPANITLTFSNRLEVSFSDGSGVNNGACEDGVRRMDAEVRFGGRNGAVSIESLANYVNVYLYITPPPPTPVSGDNITFNPNATPTPTATPVQMGWDDTRQGSTTGYFYAELPCGAFDPGSNTMIVEVEQQNNPDMPRDTLAGLQIQPTITPTATPAPPALVIVQVDNPPEVVAPFDRLLQQLGEIFANQTFQRMLEAAAAVALVLVGIWFYGRYRRQLLLNDILIRVETIENQRSQLSQNKTESLEEIQEADAQDPGEVISQRPAAVPLIQGFRRMIPYQRYIYTRDVKQDGRRHATEVFAVMPGRTPAELRIEVLAAEVRVNDVGEERRRQVEYPFPIRIEWSAGDTEFRFTLDDPEERARYRFSEMTRSRQR